MTRDKLKGNEELDMDVRFLLANERTLLAWIRTGLTFQAGGFALAHFANAGSGGDLSGIFAILAGGAMALIGYSRFRAADRAIRQGTLPKQGKGPTIEVAIVVLTAFVLAVVQVASTR